MTQAFRPVLAIHGGAGAISKKTITSNEERIYRETLSEITQSGIKVIEQGGSAIDAVTLAVSLLEDSELFNAGKGSVFTAHETHELDASIMCGKSLKTGAVSAVNHIKNPIKAARAILLQSHHAFFTGEGAHIFARQHGIEMVDPSFFSTDFRKKQLDQIREAGIQEAILDHNAQKLATLKNAPLDENNKMGTVGAVALDKEGNLAAATSTGGLTNKQIGRIGDTPIIGAGTYANNKTCAISCTGQGERFIELVAAYDTSALMEYAHLDVKAASDRVILEKLTAIQGVGGLIAIDAQGNVNLPFNSEGMYRGCAFAGTKAKVAIYNEALQVV